MPIALGMANEIGSIGSASEADLLLQGRIHHEGFRYDSIDKKQYF